MPDLVSSKVVSYREPPAIRTVPTTPTAVAAMQGITEKGPTGVPTVVTSFRDYRRIFGGYIADSVFPLMVELFFAEGGTRLWVNRVVHYTDVSDANTKTSAKATVTLTSPSVATQGTVLGANTEPFDLEPGDTLDVDVDGGGATTATFNATAAARTSGSTETFGLTNGDTLTLQVDGGATQTVTFLTAEFSNIALATAAEVAAVINAKATGLQATAAAGAVTITSDKRGTGSGINVTGGTANAVLNFTTGLINGTGNVADIDAVTAAEVKTVVEAAVAGCTVTDVGGAVQIVTDTVGSTGSIQVAATSINADTVLGLDNAVHAGTDAGVANALTIQGKYDGAYANGPTNFQVIISDATDGDATHFNLTEVVKGVSGRTYANAVNDGTSTNDISAQLNSKFGSEFIAGVFVASGRPSNGTYSLSGGDDGLVGLVDADWIGSQAANTGFYAFDPVKEIRVIGTPDNTDEDVQVAMQDYADITRNQSMFAVVGIPDLLASDAVAHVNAEGINGRTETSAVYWPHAFVTNPSTAIYGSDEELLVSPVALLMGLYSRVDGARDGGVFDEPAGTEIGRLVSVRGLPGGDVSEAFDERKRDIVQGANINPITAEPGIPFYVDGHELTKSDGPFPSVSQSRGVIFISESIKTGMNVYRHRANDEDTRDSVKRTIEAFLLLQFRRKAFRHPTPEECYQVDTDANTVNTAVEREAKRLNAEVALATQRPIKWVILRFSQDQRDVASEVAA